MNKYKKIKGESKTPIIERETKIIVMAGLTKPNFETIAEIFKNNIINYKGDEDFKITSKFIKDLSDYFKTQNPLFNEKQFKKACLK